MRPTKHYSFVTFLIAFAPLTESAFAVDLNCPSEIKTTQALTGAHQGFEAFVDKANERHLLKSVLFYDGPPAELASLVPDNEASEAAPYWTFGPRKNGRAIYESCIYSDTAVELVREVPSNVTKCKVIFDSAANASIDGYEIIKSIVCESAAQK